FVFFVCFVVPSHSARYYPPRSGATIGCRCRPRRVASVIQTFQTCAPCEKFLCIKTELELVQDDKDRRKTETLATEKMTQRCKIRCSNVSILLSLICCLNPLVPAEGRAAFRPRLPFH